MRMSTAALIASLVLLASGCGSTDDPTSPTGEATEATPAGTITVDHALGTLELDEVPERVVALELVYAEDLVALGVDPVGVADVESYRQFVGDPELPPGVTDVGTRQEPSLEAIASLEPDLIIGPQFRHEPIYDQLSAIAPTLLFDPYPEGSGAIGQLEEMEQTFRQIATAVGASERAEAVLADMEEAFDEAGSRLVEAGLATQEFVVAQGFTAQEVPTLRVFTDNAMAVGILEEIGLENAWGGEPDRFGFNTVDLEALTAAEQANLLYSVQAGDDIVAESFAGNPLWQDLAFVQEDRAYPLGAETWLFGGPVSAEKLVEVVADVLTA
ncbi:MAG: ABC transporter substrate-binding protein [Acidimicrobiales bacterium]